ncbi:MAG: LysR family transcriptional regulator [Dinoroseobacter sp.]|nr:LysR family transcriptional regulator [Dinoroseobacter sp.]
MKIDEISLLLAVAEAGSFAAVARTRGLDPSQVSRAVAGLEAQLGARLFQRSTRSMSLTDAGARYVTRLRPLLEDLEAANAELREMRARPQGKLRFSASVAFGQEMIVPLLPELRAKLPDLELDLVFTDVNLDLVAEGIDLAIRLAPAPKGELISRKLCQTRYRAVAAPDILSRKPEKPGELSELPAIIHAVPGMPGHWRFRSKSGEEEQVPVSGAIACSSALAVRDCVRRRLGVALLADWLVEQDLASGQLIDLFPDYASTPTRFDTAAWILYPSRRYLPQKTRAVVDFVVSHLGTAP